LDIEFVCAQLQHSSIPSPRNHSHIAKSVISKFSRIMQWPSKIFK